MKMKTRLVVLAAGIALAVSPTPAFADGAGHNANIRNGVKNSTLLICQHAASTTACAKNSRHGTLKYNETSKGKYGWADTDMFWVPYGKRAGGFKGPRWVKVAGGPGSLGNYTAYVV